MKRRKRMDPTWGTGWGPRRVAWVVLLVLGATAAVAPRGRTRVEYDVELSTVGTLLVSGPCPSVGGTDKLTGTLWGFEPAPPDEDNTYYGTLVRDTDVNVCDVRTLPPGDRHVVCSMNIKGFASQVPVELTVHEGGRGAYLQAADTSVLVVVSSVTGTCDPAEMAQLQRDYGNMSTAGSPDGQPIELPGLPPSGPYPHTFGANPPESIWTLKVLARRP